MLVTLLLCVFGFLVGWVTYDLLYILKPKKITVICSDQQFGDIILNILSGLGEPIKHHLRNTVVQVLDDVPKNAEPKTKWDQVRLGLHIRYSSGPDKIELYKNNIITMGCQPGNTVEQCLRRTLMHEIGHHFGYDHKKLSSLGL